MKIIQITKQMQSNIKEKIDLSDLYFLIFKFPRDCYFYNVIEHGYKFLFEEINAVYKLNIHTSTHRIIYLDDEYIEDLNDIKFGITHLDKFYIMRGGEFEFNIIFD
mgnify:CR=1 FL=1